MTLGIEWLRRAAAGSVPTILLFLIGLLFVNQANAAPVLSDFTPESGAPGTSVTLSGSGFANVTDIRFGNAPAIFVVDSNNRIFATVPLDGTSGPITLGSASGTTASAKSFFVAPRITDFVPARGPTNSQVLVFGDNFEGATAVAFNGTNAASFSVTAPTQLTVTVPVGATTGPISVTTPVGTAQSVDSFLVSGNEPFITSFSPTNGAPGTLVTLTGGNFAGPVVVQFNGTNAPNPSVVSPTQIRVAVPPSASSGPITVTNAVGKGTSPASFFVTTAPVITDFDPIGGPPGTEVTINGANFAGATAVKFAGKDAAKASINAATQIRATVPVGATNGPISVVTPFGTGVSLDDFLTGSAPIITDFDPHIAPGQASLVIRGFNFTGTRAVSFAGAGAAFTVVAPTQINAIVPPNATNGPITVTTASGSATTIDSFFLRTGKPIIRGLDPTAGLPNSIVTIEGLDLSGATSVKFNGVAANFTPVSDTQISALVPENATTGPISVSNPFGTTVSTNRFIVAPRLTSFSPASGVVGTKVTIQGTNLTDILAVRFNGVAAGFTNSATNQLTATVPLEGTSGSISVTTPGGIIASPNAFLVLPNISSFSPSSGPAGSQVKILGSGFANVMSISFGGANATTADVLSSTQIVAVVPTRAVSGPITVTTASGVAASSKIFAVGPAANLTVTQAASAAQVLEAQPLTYIVIVTNQGPVTATQVVLGDTPDPNVFISSAQVTPGTLSQTGATLQASIPNLASGSAAKLTLTVLPLLAGPITNLVSVTSTVTDPDPSDNTSSLTNTVLLNPAELSVTLAPANQIQLSWPTAATNFVLQASDRIVPSPNWQTLTVAPVVNGNTKVVTLTPGLGTKFYRLTRP